mmetsp:Transcript_7351/g.24391  ORF Transcript_7351/g.24391 Transcript_7351/m.24391 type:complete len:225 (+) Transcript_7351:562-1236(+)
MARTSLAWGSSTGAPQSRPSFGRGTPSTATTACKCASSGTAAWRTLRAKKFSAQGKGSRTTRARLRTTLSTSTSRTTRARVISSSGSRHKERRRCHTHLRTRICRRAGLRWRRAEASGSSKRSRRRASSGRIGRRSRTPLHRSRASFRSGRPRTSRRRSKDAPPPSGARALSARCTEPSTSFSTTTHARASFGTRAPALKPAPLPSSSTKAPTRTTRPRGPTRT